MVDDDDTKMMDAPHEYTYYPAPMYDNLPSKLEHTLPLPERRIKEECLVPPAVATGWQGGGCGRFQGMETSRGYYPEMQTHTGC